MSDPLPRPTRQRACHHDTGLPDWPLLLDEVMMARLVCMTRAKLWRLVNAGCLPAPRNLGEGCLRWSLDEVRDYICTVFGLDALDRRRQLDRQMAQEAFDALAAHALRPRRGSKKHP